MANLKTKDIVVAGTLASLSAAVQLIHIGYQSVQWGMWIDIVAVSWFIAYFLYGLGSSLLVSLAGSLVITMFAPDTWLGASMKFSATIPVILSLFLLQKLRKKTFAQYKNWKLLLIPLVIGIIFRLAVIIPLNYYYAIPIWTGMSPQKAMAVIPWYVIGVFNALQTIIDVILAWILVYRFKLQRFSAGKLSTDENRD